MKKLSVSLLLLLHLIYPVCLAAGALIGREFVLFSDWGFALLLTVPTIPMAFIAAPGSLTKALITAIILDSLCFLRCDTELTTVFAILWFICCAILYLRSSSHGAARRLLLIVVVLTIVILTFSLLSATVDDWLGTTSSTWSIESPNGTYTVYLCTMNYGIAGGTTTLSARDNSKAVDILIGKFNSPTEEIGTIPCGGIFDEKTWPDEHTLLIGDKEFKMP